MARDAREERGRGRRPRRQDRMVILRDLAIFGFKLVLDGLKDVIVIWLAIGAAGFDFLFPPVVRGQRFYAVMRTAERFDKWLNLYGAAERATAEAEGLFGASQAGADSLLGRIESIVTGRDERNTTRANHTRG